MSSVSHKGFTLIEIVIFLVLLGIFGVFLVQYINTSTRSSVSGFNWLSEITQLQHRMEDITAEYRRILTETDDESVTTHADLISLKEYAEDLSHHGSFVYEDETGFITFDANGVSGPWPPDKTIQYPTHDPVLIITLRQGDQKVSALFMSSE